MFTHYSCRKRRMAIQMLEKETTDGSGGSESKKNVDAECFTTSVENLISGQSTEENTYDSLQPASKLTAEENHYDSLPPRFLQLKCYPLWFFYSLNLSIKLVLDTLLNGIAINQDSYRFIQRLRAPLF